MFCLTYKFLKQYFADITRPWSNSLKEVFDRILDRMFCLESGTDPRNLV